MSHLTNQFFAGVTADRMNAARNKVGKIVGTNLPSYTLPHIQWQQHIQRGMVGSSAPQSRNALMNIRRYLPLKITR